MWGKKSAPPPPPPPSYWESSAVDTFHLPSFFQEVSVLEMFSFIAFFGFLLAVNLHASTFPMKKKATLNMQALNQVNIFKECFLGYVNAGMLEPILAIASSDADTSAKSYLFNFFQLLGLFSWLYLLSDAFDLSDTQQAFIYWDRVSQQGQTKSLPGWLKKAREEGLKSKLKGSLVRDMALWFMLACSFAAFCGVASHRDVIHSHAIIVLWICLHHQSRKATAWRGTGYFHTLFSPSAALLPLEYCLNFTDQEMVGDEDAIGDLNKWRSFIKLETRGLDLVIEA